ncbi:hypothetical protein G9A89_010811 [Geosiphon pyriformis]|nr:hypothetical protein G9A89_010811 [Geosiphon pyriformis]
MSSSKGTSEDLKSPKLVQAQCAWEEVMVTPTQLSVTDTTASEILDPVSLFYNQTSLSQETTSTGNSIDLKTNLPTELEQNKLGVPNDGIFTFENFFDVDDLRGPSSDTSEDLFVLTSPDRTPATSPFFLSPRTIQPVMLTSSNTAVSSPSSQSSIDGLASPLLPHTPEEASNLKKKQNGGRKRKAESLEEKEARARERVLRNRHAAQMSRDKKRRQLADLEAQNALLKEDNTHLSKRIKLVEDENSSLSAKLEAISAQLSEIQSQLAVSEVTKLLFDGVRGSAASATLETQSLAANNDKGEKITITTAPSETILLPPSPKSIAYPRENSKKSLQRHVKVRSLYGTSTLQIPSFQILMLPPHILNQLLLTFSIVFWTTIGHSRFYLQFSNKKQKVFVKDVVISELVHRYNMKRWLRSVKVKRGRGASNLKLVPRDWRKYPP